MLPRKLGGQAQRFFVLVPFWQRMSAPVQQIEHNRNKQSGVVPVVTDDAVHAPTGALHSEDSITYKCHEGYSVDDTADGDTSFLTLRGAALNSSVVVSPVSHMSEETSCRKVTCDVHPDASFCRVFAEAEVSSQDVGPYTCQAGETATYVMGESGTLKGVMKSVAIWYSWGGQSDLLRHHFSFGRSSWHNSHEFVRVQPVCPRHL